MVSRLSIFPHDGSRGAVQESAGKNAASVAGRDWLSDRPDDTRKAIDYSISAPDEAESVFAYEDALSPLRPALAIA